MQLVQENSEYKAKRRRKRVKAVLPVKLTGNDASGQSYSDVAHTLDITSTGVRLGAVHRKLQVGSKLILQYKQHRAEFEVVWVRAMARTKEHQVGLQATVPKDVWGLNWGYTSSDQPDMQSCPA